MNLTKLFETQKILRDRIGYNEPDRFNKLVLALLVELGECANEWRGFKFWSKCQKPKGTFLTTEGATEENAVEYVCANDECRERFDSDDENLKDVFGGITEECPKCEVGYLYAMRPKNPLLEEYVDGLHFILELGLDKGFDKVDFPYLHEHNIGVYTEINTNEQFINTFTAVNEFMINENLESYEELFLYFIGLSRHFNFTWEEVEQAYYAKNKINHKRQEEGY